METAKKIMGRPRKANPLTGAERHQRWRERQQAQVAELLKIYQDSLKKPAQ